MPNQTCTRPRFAAMRYGGVCLWWASALSASFALHSTALPRRPLLQKMVLFGAHSAPWLDLWSPAFAQKGSMVMTESCDGGPLFDNKSGWEKGVMSILDSQLHAVWTSSRSPLKKNPSLFRQWLSQDMRETLILALEKQNQITVPIFDAQTQLDYVFQIQKHPQQPEGRFIVLEQDMSLKHAKELSTLSSNLLQVFYRNYNEELEGIGQSLMGILSECTTQEDMSVYMDRIGQQLFLLFRHTEVINDYFKLVLGDWKGESTYLYLSDFLQKILSKLADPMERSGVCPLLITPEDIVCIKTDAVLLERIIGHLLSNALNTDQKDSHVTIRLTLEDNNACMTVIDDGMGIPEEDMEDFFGVHVDSALAQSQRASNGLGLAIVRRGIALCGGGVSALSARGIGSFLHIRLPALSLSEIDVRHLSRSGGSHEPFIPFFDASLVITADGFRRRVPMRRKNTRTEKDGANAKAKKP